MLWKREESKGQAGKEMKDGENERQGNEAKTRVKENTRTWERQGSWRRKIGLLEENKRYMQREDRKVLVDVAT